MIEQLEHHSWAAPIKTMTGFLIFSASLMLFAVMSCSSSNPPPPGIRDGHLFPCPQTPNCVNSDAEGGASFIDPLFFSGSPEAAWKNIKSAISSMGGSIEKEEHGYLWATFTTRIFRFVDDLELKMDKENGVIHIRSASRTGYTDFGLNRKRVEELRARFRSVED